MPELVGSHRDRLFAFVRKTKALPFLADAEPEVLYAVAGVWHAKAAALRVRIKRTGVEVPALPDEWTKDDTASVFLDMWREVKTPEGQSEIDALYQQALESPLPAESAKVESHKVQLLVALCWQLQRRAGDVPFFLGSREAGRLFGVDFGTAARWLRLLVSLKILTVVNEYDAGRRQATEYRYPAAVVTVPKPEPAPSPPPTPPADDWWTPSPPEPPRRREDEIPF